LPVCVCDRFFCFYAPPGKAKRHRYDVNADKAIGYLARVLARA
jgi:hypothetical protein